MAVTNSCKPPWHELFKRCEISLCGTGGCATGDTTIQQHEVSSACIRPASRHRPGLTQKPEGVWVPVHSFSPFFLPPSWPGLLPPNTVTPVQATLRKYWKPWGKFIPCTASQFWPIGVHSWRHQDNDTSWVALKCIQYALCSRLPKNSFLFKKPNSVLYSILRLLHSFIFVFTFSCIWLALSTKGPLWGELPSWRPIQQCLFKLCIILSISYDSA